MSTDVETIVVGAGVVGLAIARSLAAALTRPEKLYAAFERLAPQFPINTVQARRGVADAMIEAGRYFW